MSQASSLKYVELSLQLKERIAQGEFNSGQQIPTEHELALHYGVSRQTVRQAIAILENENYLVRRRGSGTYVQQLNAQREATRPLKSVAIVVVDASTNAGGPNNYYAGQILEAERWAAQHGVALAVSNISTLDMLKGHRPALLSQGNVQAVIFDGWVTDLHCLLAEEQQLPYLIVGNRPISPQLPQLRIDTEASVRMMADYLLDLAPDQPLAILLESLELQICREMLMAYTEIIAEQRQSDILIAITNDYDVPSQFQQLLQRANGPFSLITRGRHTPAIISSYKQHNLDPAQYPIICMASNIDENAIQKLDRHYVARVCFHEQSLMVDALEALAHAYREGTTDSLYLTREPLKVIPAQAHAKQPVT